MLLLVLVQEFILRIVSGKALIQMSFPWFFDRGAWGLSGGLHIAWGFYDFSLYFKLSVRL